MIGILGGTFDPIHFGHLRPALELYEALEFDQLRFIPNGRPPHRADASASPEQRLHMVQRAVAGQSGFIADDREVRRAGASYTADTLAELRAEFGEAPLCLCLGMDAFLGLHTWHQWERIPALAHLVVAHRPGWSLSSEALPAPLRALVEDRLTDTPAELGAAPAGRLVLRAVTQLDISATTIRALIASRHSARYLLPDSVIGYILEHDIYVRR